MKGAKEDTPRLRCERHPSEMLCDEFAEDGTIRPSALCQQCTPLRCVDVVRGLYRAIGDWPNGR